MVEEAVRRYLQSQIHRRMPLVRRSAVSTRTMIDSNGAFEAAIKCVIRLSKNAQTWRRSTAKTILRPKVVTRLVIVGNPNPRALTCRPWRSTSALFSVIAMLPVPSYVVTTTWVFLRLGVGHRWRWAWRSSDSSWSSSATAIRTTLLPKKAAIISCRTCAPSLT